MNDYNDYKERLCSLTRASNDLLFSVVGEMADTFEYGHTATWSEQELESRCQALLNELHTERNQFVYCHQDVLLQALGEKGHESKLPAHEVSC